jgi:hypothetical protein
MMRFFLAATRSHKGLETTDDSVFLHSECILATALGCVMTLACEDVRNDISLYTVIQTPLFKNVPMHFLHKMSVSFCNGVKRERLFVPTFSRNIRLPNVPQIFSSTVDAL